jgi:integrase/recombinase XerD
MPEQGAMGMETELADFLRYCKVERRLAQATCRAYARDVGACVAFLRSIGIGRLEDVRIRDLRRFLDTEAAHRPAPASRARTLAALGYAVATSALVPRWRA